MIFQQVMQYCLLSLMGAGVGLQNINKDYVYPRVGFKSEYFTHNTLPVYNNKATSNKEFMNSYIEVESTYTVFKVLDFNVGMQGYATKDSGFKGGFGGGYWGSEIRIWKGLKLYYRHDSYHCFDTANDCGSVDRVGIFISIGYDYTNYSDIYTELRH